VSAIDKLNRVSALQATDLIPVFSQRIGDDAAATVTVLSELLQTLLVATGEMVTQYESPTATGFTINVTPFVDGGSVYLLLKPSGALAAGTINLPSQLEAVDGQEVLCHCSQTVTTLTVGGNGASTGAAPTTLAAGSFFRLRYDAVTTTWYRVG
jgi:hypothetical protein